MENKIEMLNFRIKRGFKWKVIYNRLPRLARESIIFEERNICDI